MAGMTSPSAPGRTVDQGRGPSPGDARTLRRAARAAVALLVVLAVPGAGALTAAAAAVPAAGPGPAGAVGALGAGAPGAAQQAPTTAAPATTAAPPTQPPTVAPTTAPPTAPPTPAPTAPTTRATTTAPTTATTAPTTTTSAPKPADEGAPVALILLLIGLLGAAVIAAVIAYLSKKNRKATGQQQLYGDLRSTLTDAEMTRDLAQQHVQTNNDQPYSQVLTPRFEQLRDRLAALANRTEDPVLRQQIGEVGEALLSFGFAAEAEWLLRRGTTPPTGDQLNRAGSTTYERRAALDRTIGTLRTTIAPPPVAR
jgi:hypothetical protein